MLPPGRIRVLSLREAEATTQIPACVGRFPLCYRLAADGPRYVGTIGSVPSSGRVLTPGEVLAVLR